MATGSSKVFSPERVAVTTNEASSIVSSSDTTGWSPCASAVPHWKAAAQPQGRRESALHAARRDR